MHRTHTGNTSETHREHTGNTSDTHRKTRRKLIGNTSETHRKTHRKHFGNTSETHRKHMGHASKNTSETYRKHIGNTSDTHPENTVAPLVRMPESVSGIVRYSFIEHLVCQMEFYCLLLLSPLNSYAQGVHEHNNYAPREARTPDLSVNSLTL